MLEEWWGLQKSGRRGLRRVVGLEVHLLGGGGEGGISGRQGLSKRGYRDALLRG